MTRLISIPPKQTPKKRKVEEDSDLESDDEEPNTKPTKNQKILNEEESDLESDEETQSTPSSAQTTEERYQHLMQILTNNPKEEFIAIDTLRDVENGDPIGKIILPTSIITSEVDKFIFNKWRKIGYINAEQNSKNCDFFDFFAWRIKYNIDGYEFADEWEKGEPPLLETPQMIQINGISYDAMAPEDHGKWEKYELIFQDLKHSLNIVIKEHFVVNFVF